MILTRKQEEGLKLALARYKAREPYTCIAGYAGTGKSTLVQFIISALGVQEHQVAYVAYTGKAAQVLRTKGCHNAMTAHRLLYQSFPKKDGTFAHIPYPSIGPYRLIVVDEVSMLPKPMWDLLLKHKIHVLALGDPGQLPPVAEEQHGILDHPHIFLDEIMRQAQESEIIRVSMDIREGKLIDTFNGSEVKIFNPADFEESMLLWADQVLVATNQTRINLNNTMRRLLGREGGPQDGDKVICLKNEWDILADNEDPLVNGTIGFLKNSYSIYVNFPRFLGGHHFDVLQSDFVSDGGALFRDINMDKKMIMTGEKCCDWKTAYTIGRNLNHKNKLPKEFTYGYAVTCHKAQGSQWEKVLIVEEKFPFDKTEHARWLYTSLTRAESRAVIIKKD